MPILDPFAEPSSPTKSSEQSGGSVCAAFKPLTTKSESSNAGTEHLVLSLRAEGVKVRKQAAGRLVERPAALRAGDLGH